MRLFFCYIATLLAVGLPAVSCTRCGSCASEPGGRGEGSDGERPAIEVPESEAAGELPLVWESIPLGADEAGFREALAGLAGLNDAGARSRVSCAPLAALDVVDPERSLIEERSAGGRELTGCALLQAGSLKSWELIAVRGALLDGKLVSLGLTFVPEAFDDLERRLTERFGAGAAGELLERSAVEEVERPARIWKAKGDLWALFRNERTIGLLCQRAEAAAKLPRPLPPARRGEPVDLEDIGLGGPLDLSEGEP
ncbi:MAG: hypothetical protein R6V85_13850 [Polyangia bacterium]